MASRCWALFQLFSFSLSLSLLLCIFFSLLVRTIHEVVAVSPTIQTLVCVLKFWGKKREFTDSRRRRYLAFLPAIRDCTTLPSSHSPFLSPLSFPHILVDEFMRFVKLYNSHLMLLWAWFHFVPFSLSLSLFFYLTPAKTKKEKNVVEANTRRRSENNKQTKKYLTAARTFV